MAALRLSEIGRFQPPDWPTRQRWHAFWLAMFAASLAAGLALVQDLLPATSATLLASCAAAVAALSTWLGWRSERAFGQHCRALLAAAENRQRSAEAQRARIAGLSASLQQAVTPVDLAQRLLSGLARGVAMQQGLCCYWDEGRQVLGAAARYGGDGADADDVLLRQPLLAPLLLEAVRSRREIIISRPGATFLRISSGLGDAEPTELCVLPLEHGGRMFALLELAALEPVSDAARSMLAEVVPVFAMCLEILSLAERGDSVRAPVAAVASSHEAPS